MLPMVISWLVRLLPCFPLLFLSRSASQATAVIPVPLEHLQRAAEAIVVARVSEVRSAFTQSRTIRTEVRLTILSQARGAMPTDAPLVLEIPGGQVETEVEFVPGTPSFVPGGLYILLLSRRDNMRWQPVQLDQGIFTVVSFPRLASARSTEPWVVGSPAIANGSLWSWSEFWTRVQTADPHTRMPAFRAEWWTAPLFSAPFQLGRPLARLFEPDEGLEVRFAIDERGDPALGPQQSREVVRQALAAWSQVPRSSLHLKDGDALQDLEVRCPDPHGQNFKVRFGDPDSMIPPPLDCRGMLALTSYRASTQETKGIENTSFGRIRCATVSFADGWENCPEWTPCNIAEIATHELGHAIGLGHSSERVPEPNTRLRDATMYGFAHFDGRCASLREDDLDALRFLYPETAPITIIGASTLPPATLDTPYSFQFQLANAQLPVSWSLDESDYCGLELNDLGWLHGSIPTCLCWARSLPLPPTPLPSPYIFVTARDRTCNWHKRFFSIPLPLSGTDISTLPLCTPTPTVVGAPTPTPLFRPPCVTAPSLPPTPTATPAPEFSATVTPPATSSPSASPTSFFFPSPTATQTSILRCVGDCDHSGQVTIDEIVRMVNIALVVQPLTSCIAADANGDDLVTIEELLQAVRTLLHGCSTAYGDAGPPLALYGVFAMGQRCYG